MVTRTSTTRTDVTRAAQPGTGGRPATGTRAARNRSRAKPKTVLTAEVLAAVLRKSDEGLSAAAIAQRADARDVQARDLLRELERTGDVRRTGVGRGTRWCLVTDEDRIAERAAELARLSAAPS